jgi:hypothetical protein
MISAIIGKVIEPGGAKSTKLGVIAFDGEHTV